MWLLYYFVVLNIFHVFALWEEKVLCPSVCTCRHEHLTEMAIFKYMHPEHDHHNSETKEFENNDVLYDDNIDIQHNKILKTATCILQTETDPLDLLNELPINVESLTLIQGFESGNKTLKLSDLKNFTELRVLELQGTKSEKEYGSIFICKIDTALPFIEYLNLDNILIENSNRKEESDTEEVVTFVYLQKNSAQPLTLIRKIEKNEILPYDQYIEQQKKDESPIFVGFKNLLLLIIRRCNLQSIHWEMFEDLSALNYLILERNNLKFIPDFAFYGTPNLKLLSLAHNKLLNIQVTDLAGLLKLEYLDLSHNNFSQLSELSFPPFPNLKLANLLNNPINVVYPNTFEVMNTTDSLVLGSESIPLKLQKNSFAGLKLLKKLTLMHLKIPLLKREIFMGMPALLELSLSGNIPEIQFDAFVEVHNLQKLILKSSNIQNISMDAFIGLSNLKVLDLSKNLLHYLPPGIFDELRSLNELYLNENNFSFLPNDIFSNIRPKLIRLTENPWHCSCDMAEWKPMLINKIKQKSLRGCDTRHDKGAGCELENVAFYKYIYDNRVAPKCATPKKYKNLSVFPVMRHKLRCSDFKPRLKKKVASTTIKNATLPAVMETKPTPTNSTDLNYNREEKMQKLRMKMHKKVVKLNDNPMKISLFENTYNRQDNNINSVANIAENLPLSFKNQLPLKTENYNLKRKIKKTRKNQNNLII